MKFILTLYDDECLGLFKLVGLLLLALVLLVLTLLMLTGFFSDINTFSFYAIIT